MNNPDLISETNASRMAGVSPVTLSRFVEAGYLKVSSDPAGEKNYLRSEICSLFGIPYEGLKVTKEYVDSPGPGDEGEDAGELDAEFDETSSDEEDTGYWAETLSPEPDGQSEIKKYKSLAEMHEKLLEIREKEIEELRKERDWLRTRIERLEEKSERDQLLLLAETQTIKRLVNITQQRKPSAIRATLEWLGIVPAKSADLEIAHPPRTIENNKD